MIASYTGKFIFVKTRKTGGTSAEIVLSSWCTGNDICTPITGEDELTRAAYGGRPMNFCADPILEAEFHSIIGKGDAAAVDMARRRIGKRMQFRNHDPASQIRDMLPELWESSFKFAVERHPYEKAMSMAFWRVGWRNGGKPASIDEVTEALDEVIDAGEYANYPLYMDGKKLIVDLVVRYPDMWKEIAQLGTKIGKKLPRLLPTAKGRFRVDRRPASVMLSLQQKRRIQEICAVEFHQMNFEV